MIPPAYNFTQDDNLNPLYCIQCRTHIPRAVSNAGRGLCPLCIAKNQQASANQALAQQAQQAANQQAIYQFNSGMGLCPQCHSSNLEEIIERDGSTASALGGAGCLGTMLGLCCFWPMLIVTIPMSLFGATSSSRIVGRSRLCRYCGHRWPV